MDTILLNVEVRDIKTSPSYLRKQRKIPAVFYGNKEKSIPLQVDYQSFRKAYDKAGGNQVIELSIDGKKKPVLVHDVQYNHLTDAFSHVDFIHVNMHEEVKAHIPVVIVGVSPAVKDLGGILTTLHHELEVKCLPGDLPHEINVDISGLEQLHSSIHLRDLTLPKGVKLTGNLDDTVVTISVAKVEVVEAPAATAAETAPAAGAAPAEGAAAAAPTGDKEKK